MSKVLMFGASGGIGSEVKALLELEHEVVSIDRDKVNLTEGSSKLIRRELALELPDIVINCAGMFGDNKVDYDDIFNVNVKTNWSILEYYKDVPPRKLVKFITIGSSSYDSGRKDYILYAATKAALFNMYQGASEYFERSKFIIGLVNPSKVRTKMIAHLLKPSSTNVLEPNDVANEIVDFLVKLEKNSYINVNYK